MTYQSNDSENRVLSDKKNEVRELLIGLLKTTQMTQSAVENEDMDDLIVNLNERQSLLKRIEGLFGRPDDEEMRALRVEAGEKYKDVIAEIGRLDAENIRTVRERRERFMEQIRVLNNQKLGTDNYGVKAKKTPAVFFDAKK